MGGLRDRRFAFTLWFPTTATSFLGTLVWLWATMGLLTAPKGGDAAFGFALMGTSIIFGAFLICPILLAVSIWQRPTIGSYGLIQTLPIILIYLGAIAAYRSVSEIIENQNLQLIVLDTQKRPLGHVRVKYETSQRTYKFSFPSSAMTGVIETGADGSALLPVPKTHEIDCEVTTDGYALLRIRMDRAWGDYTWHQTSIDWQFPPSNPKLPWEGHGGQVQTDVDDSNPMHLAVYLPKSNVEIVPSYGPLRTCHDDQGKQIWTPEPSTITTR